MSALEDPIGEQNDGDALEFGRWLFAQDCQFLLGAAHLDQVPDTGLPEIAFAGRSNVGKSSLINALTGRKALAKTSNTPGRTQELNFFMLGSRLMIADLPGYGFAQAPKAKVARWTGLADAYLKGRPLLRRACLLIDARHGIKEVDRAVMKQLDAAAVSYQAVLTKCDKLGAAELEACLKRVAQEVATHTAAHPRIFATSARDNVEIAELRAALAALAAPHPIPSDRIE
ncbi:ribosome biogenesis GTP-binding protein YihA/YsxC [Shumkonia mesophila]|uniref:ribosome biogenesis GTP-binding protein YihA/YsxC n=1 Tax=Shumkonia mesophila TaxID=2838854 RepID=UPI002935270C|nr:ribosome biogenesis GTP-binding protein YihA/YsxC [Shumkonia mesophila]